MTAVTTKIVMRPIVIRCNTSSPPRRSNLPKSPVPGTIESPDPFACIITTRIIKIESIKIVSFRIWYTILKRYCGSTIIRISQLAIFPINGNCEIVSILASIFTKTSYA